MESTLALVITFSLLGGVVSLVGGLFLLVKKFDAKKLAAVMTPFAAGALLAAVFADILPESIHEEVGESTMLWTLCGIIVFFALEYSFRWFHHHHEHAEDQALKSMIIIGDTLHNALDGVAIAVSFLISPASGLVTTMAVAAHEIPQEIGDFGVLLSRGMRRRNVLLVNIISALATTVTAAIVFIIGTKDALPLSLMLGLSAGFLLYIAAADLIPTIHHDAKQRRVTPIVLMLLGALLVVGLTTYTHQFTDQNIDYDPGIIDTSEEQP